MIRIVYIIISLFTSMLFADNCTESVKTILKKEDNYSYYIDFDKEWNTYGTLIFSDNLECHIASSGRQICNNDKSYALPLFGIKNIIIRDAKKIIKEQKPLGKKIYKYREIYKYYNFDNSPYSVLFKYLFFLDSYVSDKKSKLDFNYSKVLQLKYLCLDKNNVVFYNDMSYYLQKAGANKEAAYLLEKIIAKFPNRTVAYYNLGDAYWALGEKKKAMKAYTTYIEQMCHKGLQKKIPKAVLERVKDK